MSRAIFGLCRPAYRDRGENGQASVAPFRVLDALTTNRSMIVFLVHPFRKG